MVDPIKCPSCGKEMIAGKYCAECGAELVPGTETMRPNEKFVDELAEKVAGRAGDIVIDRLKKEKELEGQKQQQQIEQPQSGQAEGQQNEKTKRGLFYRIRAKRTGTKA